MNKMIQSTLLRDILGTAFCLVMTLVLLMVFSGCSEDSKPVSSLGGAGEETGIYALSGRVGDAIPMMLTIQASSDSSTIHANVTSNTAPSPKGTIVVVYELDSLTLDTTGRSFADTISNDSGSFAFKNLPITSPYVMVQMQDSCYTIDCKEHEKWWIAIWDPDYKFSIDSSVKYPNYLYAIVDLRKYSTIRVNSLTNAKSDFLKKYFADGMSFAEASKKAEQTLLEHYGIYEDLGDFEELNDNSELEVLSFLIQHWYVEAPNHLGYLNYFNEIHPKIVATFSDKIKQYYLNTLKLFDYEIAILAHQHDLGQCTESRENESYSTEDGLFICHSKKWALRDSSSKTIEHINGTMLDARDGRTYKTVTYNWGDVTQTWMAENLNFADTTSPSADQNLKESLRGRTQCWTNDPSCEIYGRFYAWRAAMNLNSSSIKMNTLGYYTTDEDPIEIGGSAILPVEEQCSSEFPYCPDLKLFTHQKEDTFCYMEDENTKRCDPTTYCRTDAYVDSIYKYCIKKYRNRLFYVLDYSQFIPPSRPVMHQGVCPDGWRIPNIEDWETLYKNIAERIDAVDNYEVWRYLDDSNATGFGNTAPIFVEINDLGNPTITFDSPDIYFAAVPDVDDNQSYGSQDDLYPAFYYYNIDTYIRIPGTDTKIPYSGSTYIPTFENLNVPVSVRCIKN